MRARFRGQAVTFSENFMNKSRKKIREAMVRVRRSESESFEKQSPSEQDDEDGCDIVQTREGCLHDAGSGRLKNVDRNGSFSPCFCTAVPVGSMIVHYA